MQAAAEIDPSQIIAVLERRALDGAALPNQPVWGSRIETVPFWRIHGMGRFWEEKNSRLSGYEQYMEDVITGFFGQRQSFGFLVMGTRSAVHLYMGLTGAESESLLPAALQGTFPGILLAEKADPHLGSVNQASSVFHFTARLTGIPTRKSGYQARAAAGSGERWQSRAPGEAGVEQIERLLRGLYGESWGYLVWATPIPENETTHKAQLRLRQLTELTKTIHAQENYQRTRNETVGPTASVTESVSRTVDQTDRWVQYATELLDHDFHRLQMGKAQGMWTVEVYLFAAEMRVLQKATALLRAIYAGEDSTPDPIRTFLPGKPGGAAPGGAGAFQTVLTSGEVATLCQFPRQEFPGYRLSDWARFDVDLPESASRTSIAVGRVIDGSHPTGGWFAVERGDFAKHGLVVGVTGSGKTNTMFHLLDKLWSQGQGIPFLVVEPAKTEYRDLLQRAAFQKALRVYTLGDERVSPFRLNPFEFEILGDDQRIHVQTHIDLLKSVFNAAFILYAPMPYVLETCLHEIYQDKGWDLTTSQNRRLPPQQRGSEGLWPVFPTLSDLYSKIDEVVDRLGYEERIQSDVKAGLKARVGSLRLGSKGLMLDTQHGIPMKEMLAHPTVLEMERIGNDDEKAFLIGLVLARLYEYRMVQARSGERFAAVQHVTVFEEAHRLLKNVRTEVGTEESNTKGQAVETFANILSEIRSYGQGVLIAEQIPTKLTPDAIKNTNLKIMHRVVAADDREIMGGTMNLDEDQLRRVTSLSAGQAVAYAEGADHPFLVEVVRQPEKETGSHTRVLDEGVRQAMQVFKQEAAQQAIYEPAPGYHRYVNAPAERQAEIYDLAQAILREEEFGPLFTGYFLGVVTDPAYAAYGYNNLLQFIRRISGRLVPHLLKQVAAAVLVLASYQIIEDRGRRYRWFYNTTGHLREQFTSAVVQVAQNFENRAEVVEALASQAASALLPFASGYRDQTEQVGPFSGCVYCAARCLYRWDVASLLNTPTLAGDFSYIILHVKDDQEMWNRLAANALEAASRLLPGAAGAAREGVALCYAAQMSAKNHFSGAAQKKLVGSIRTVIHRSEKPAGAS